MRAWKLGFVGTGFVLLLVFFSSAAEARVSIGLSIGTSFVHRYPGYCYDYYPYSPWSGGYYSWLDRDRYIWWDAGPYRHFPSHRYWRGRSRSSVGIWIGEDYPMVVGAPVVVDCQSVGTARSRAAERAKGTAARVQMSQAVWKNISEQLKILKAGDKDKRIQTIHELEAFIFDNRVRRALEEILLSDPEPDVRKEVAVSFGRTENQLVLSALTQAKENDAERDVRQAAYRSIIMIKGY